MIAVIDYNVGNVQSVCNAFDYIGRNSALTSDPAQIKNAAGIVLPGVAAFGYAAKELDPLAEFIKKIVITQGKPILGICVGFQLLFEQSFEHGTHKGLGLVKGDIIPIPPPRTIPHMGWNKVEHKKNMDIFAGFDECKHFYFAHSYYADVKDQDAKIAYTDYDMPIPASIQKKNIYGTQFHPEKSGTNGLKILENFANICESSK